MTFRRAERKRDAAEGRLQQRKSQINVRFYHSDSFYSHETLFFFFIIFFCSWSCLSLRHIYTKHPENTEEPSELPVSYSRGRCSSVDHES